MHFRLGGNFSSVSSRSGDHVDGCRVKEETLLSNQGTQDSLPYFSFDWLQKFDGDKLLQDLIHYKYFKAGSTLSSDQGNQLSEPLSPSFKILRKFPPTSPLRSSQHESNDEIGIE